MRRSDGQSTILLATVHPTRYFAVPILSNSYSHASQTRHSGANSGHISPNSTILKHLSEHSRVVVV